MSSAAVDGMTETLAAFLDSIAAAAGEREVLAYAPRGTVTQRMSANHLRLASRVAAAKLLALGAGKSTRIALLCSNRIEWLPIAFGILRIGAILVPFSTLWKRDEIAYGLNHADVEILITLPAFLKHDYVAALHEIVPELGDARRPLFSAHAPSLRRVLVLGQTPASSSVTASPVPGTGDRWDDLPQESDDLLDAVSAAVVGCERAAIFFTSGTTAQAKAVVHSHAALALSARRIAENVGITTGDSWWGHMPLFWSGGFVLGALATLAGGGRVVLQEVVDAPSALDLLESEGCTLMAGWHQAGPLLEQPDFAQRRLRLNKGSYHPLAKRLMGAEHHAVGMYGMSETATCIACARWDDPEPIRAGTFGRPLAGMTVKIVDPDSRQPVVMGETGEIVVKGPTLMDGYYKVEREQSFDAEGFFSTGDLGFFDEHGYLHFATRLKDVIKTAGVNVAAVEVEEALQRHPAVQSAHVVGVPDRVRGENVAAFVVLRSGKSSDERELQNFCRTALASYKVPRQIFIVADDDLPRTGTGKIEKVALRRAAAGRVPPAVSDRG